MAYQGKLSNFILRLLSACILAPLVLYIIDLSGFYFTAMILFASIIMGGEWFHITEKQSTTWKILGALYILLSSLSLLWLIEQESLVGGTVQFSGVNTVISIFVLVWANDIGGYVFGKLLGGKKLCPQISPNKTWSGFFGGILCAVAVSPILEEHMFTGLIIAIIASMGDLLESWAKRRCKIKDSGTLIPGHGGLLDRVDGILLVSLYVALFSLIFQ